MFVRPTLLTALGVLALASGCSYEHNPNAYYPANWESTYVEIDACKQTSHPAGGYVRVLIEPEGLTDFCAGNELPEGTVILKEQYGDDSACSSGGWELFTVMRKNSETNGGWDWQQVDNLGDLQGPSGERSYCLDCHTSFCGGGRCVKNTDIPACK